MRAGSPSPARSLRSMNPALKCSSFCWRWLSFFANLPLWFCSNVSKCGSHHSFKTHFSLLRLILSPPKSPSESSKLSRAFLIIARTLHSSLRLNELYEVDMSTQIASIARVFLERVEDGCVKVLRFSPFI